MLCALATPDSSIQLPADAEESGVVTRHAEKSVASGSLGKTSFAHEFPALCAYTEAQVHHRLLDRQLARVEAQVLNVLVNVWKTPVPLGILNRTTLVFVA